MIDCMSCPSVTVVISKGLKQSLSKLYCESLCNMKIKMMTNTSPQKVNHLQTVSTYIQGGANLMVKPRAIYKTSLFFYKFIVVCMTE